MTCSKDPITLGGMMDEIIWKKAFNSGRVYRMTIEIKENIVDAYVSDDMEEVKIKLDHAQTLVESIQELLLGEE